MKTIFLAFFLLFAFSTTLPSSSADFVYDTYGEPLRNGGSYHMIISGLWGDRLRIGRSGNETCPQTVVPARSEISPIRCRPHKKFFTSFRVRSSALISQKYPNVSQRYQNIVDEGSVKQVNVRSLWLHFKTVNSESHDYKLVYCPGDDDSCDDLKIHNSLLNAKDGKSFGVRFERATESSPEWSII